MGGRFSKQRTEEQDSLVRTEVNDDAVAIPMPEPITMDAAAERIRTLVPPDVLGDIAEFLDPINAEENTATTNKENAAKAAKNTRELITALKKIASDPNYLLLIKALIFFSNPENWKSSNGDFNFSQLPVLSATLTEEARAEKCDVETRIKNQFFELLRFYHLTQHATKTTEADKAFLYRVEVCKDDYAKLHHQLKQVERIYNDVLQHCDLRFYYYKSGHVAPAPTALRQSGRLSTVYHEPYRYFKKNRLASTSGKNIFYTRNDLEAVDRYFDFLDSRNGWNVVFHSVLNPCILPCLRLMLLLHILLSIDAAATCIIYPIIVAIYQSRIASFYFSNQNGTQVTSNLDCLDNDFGNITSLSELLLRNFSVSNAAAAIHQICDNRAICPDGKDKVNNLGNSTFVVDQCWFDAKTGQIIADIALVGVSYLALLVVAVILHCCCKRVSKPQDIAQGYWSGENIYFLRSSDEFNKRTPYDHLIAPLGLFFLACQDAVKGLSDKVRLNQHNLFGATPREEEPATPSETSQSSFKSCLSE